MPKKYKNGSKTGQNVPNFTKVTRLMQNEQEKDSKLSENDWLFANGKNVESFLNYL